MLKVQHLTIRRGNRELLRNLTFQVKPGHLLSVAGPNGCGKSSLLRAIAGLLPVSQGKVTKPEQFIYLNHHQGVPKGLTPFEVCNFYLQIQGPKLGKAAQRLAIGKALEKMGLWLYRSRPCRELSAGLEQRLHLARLCLLPGNLWLLDEPLNALDSTGQQLFQQQLNQHLLAGNGAMVVSHQPLTSEQPYQTMTLGDQP